MTAPSSPPPSLKVLAESKTIGVTKITSFRIDPELIVFEEGFNLRDMNSPDTLAHIERLYGAMKAGAFIPPVDISMVNGVVTARDGHCRTLAAMRLKVEVPEFTLECRQLRGNEADAVLHMLGTGGGGKPLTPLEQGHGYARLIRFGMTPQAIAAKLGVTRVTVDNGLALAEAPVEVQQMISQGEVSATTARDAVKAGPEGVEALKAAVTEERAKPVKKNGKKSKVTAKKLKGTAAEKKGKKSDAPSIVERSNIILSTTYGFDKIPEAPNAKVTITVDTETAVAVAKFLKEYAGDGDEDKPLYEMLVAIEISLM